MSIIVNTWGLSHYDFGWEIRVDVIDQENGRVWNDSYGWDHSPSDKEVSDAIQVVLERIELRKQLEQEAKPVEEII